MAEMTREEALETIEPFYDLFRAEKRDWDKGLAVLADDWKAYYTNDDYRDKEETAPFLQGLFDLVPDIDVEIKHIIVGGNEIVARCELSGTPARDFMVPHSGKSFSIMTIDIHRVNDEGKIEALWHAEDWQTAIAQLSAED